MSRKDGRDRFRAGYRDAKFKSHAEAIGRAAIHGTVIGVAIFYPAAIWKRVVGAIIAFLFVGLILQFRAARRSKAKTD